MEAPTPSPQTTSGEHARSPHDVVRGLAFLGQDLKAGLSLQAMLSAAATHALQLLEADLCVVMLLDDGVPGTLHVAAHASALMLDFHPVVLSIATWELLREHSANGLRERDSAAATLAALDELAQKRLNPVGDQSLHAGLVVPVATEERPIGAIACYRHLRQWSAQEFVHLLLIAEMLALASVPQTVPAERSTPASFVSALLSGDEFAAQRQAAYLGIDLGRPRVVIRIELRLGPESEQLPAAYQQQAEHLRLLLQEQWPGTVVVIQENLLTCLVEEELSERLVAGLRSQVRQLERQNVRLWAGVSYPCRLDTYPQGARQADEALRIGWLRSKSAGEVVLYDEIGAYRYVNKLTQVEEVDIYQQAIQRIVWHDRHEQTEFLKALRIYLAYGGNALAAASQLGIHRNTMSKWLEQLQELCGENIQLKNASNRVTFLLALMHHDLTSENSASAVDA